MTASKRVKAAGLKSLNEVCEMTGQSAQTLTNWHNNKSELFNIIIIGCSVKKNIITIIQ